MTELVIPVTVTKIENYIIYWKASQTSLKTVRYLGTEEQWAQVDKAAHWDNDNEEYELVFGEAQTSARILVVYFSAQNHTEAVANYIASATGGELFELIPVEPYSDADLNYNNHSSRVYREYENESLRDIALTQTAVENWSAYDTVFIGYPIWWGIAAWPVNNFIKNNDFTGKTVIPFCTSVSSGLGQSGALLADMAGTGNWQTGMRFSSNVSQSTVTAWINSLINEKGELKK